MSESINDLMKSDLRGAWNLNKDARNTGWAVWVRVKYQQYQDVSVWSPSFPILWRHCEKPQWVTHHQWVRVPNWSHQTTGYLDSPAGSYTIAWQLPHMYYYADQKVLRGGTQ